MQALIASYSTPAEIQSYPYMSATVRTIQSEQFKSPSLFLLTEDRYHEEVRLNTRVLGLLAEFSELDNNWDEDGALAPDPGALDRTAFIAQVLENIGQPIYNAAPGPNGEILLDLRDTASGKSVELIFFPQRTVAVFFPAKALPFQKDFRSENYLPGVLEWLKSTEMGE